MTATLFSTFCRLCGSTNHTHAVPGSPCPASVAERDTALGRYSATTDGTPPATAPAASPRTERHRHAS